MRQGGPDRLGGEFKQLRLRLMAMPVPEEIANMRRMKAKKEVRGHAPSEEILALMSWSIFLTTIEDPSLTPTMIMQLYGLRWRIENIFKTWKSFFSFDKVHPFRKPLRLLLTARLIMIVICYHSAFVPLCEAIRRQADKQLSLMKLMRYIGRNIARLPRLLAETAGTKACWLRLHVFALTISAGGKTLYRAFRRYLRSCPAC